MDKEIIRRLEMIENELKGIKKSCENMDSHISFVEAVYDKLRRPLEYAMSVVSNRIANGQSAPPKHTLSYI